MAARLAEAGFRTETQGSAETLGSRIRKAQTEKMLVEAKAQIDQESKNAEGKLTQKIGIIASDLLTKALEGMFSEKDQKQILEKTLKNIFYTIL